MEETGKRFSFVRIIVICVILRGISSIRAEVSSKTLTSPSGSFSNPTFPSHYPPATEYIWLISAKDGMHIKLTFDVIDIEAYKGTCIDIVEIKDGDSSDAPLIDGFCNANKPTYSITSSGKSLRVWFQSARNSDGGAGFNASYTTLNDEGCGGRLTSATGSFSSPNYPLPYPSNRECIWDIIIQPGRYIHVEFHGTYHIEVLCFYMECVCMDTLDIKDGNRPLPYAPHSGYCFAKPRPFTSKTNSVSVKFVTNNAGRYEGFNATYTSSLTPGCGADLHHGKGVISSPNFPHSYHSFRTCIWRITVAPGHYITLKFHAFDVNKTDGTCSVDSVKIHDGYTKDSPLLAHLCNTNTVDMINSTWNNLYIEFTAGLNIHARGFQAIYNSHLQEIIYWTNRPSNVTATLLYRHKCCGTVALNNMELSLLNPRKRISSSTCFYQLHVLQRKGRSLTKQPPPHP